MMKKGKACWLLGGGRFAVTMAELAWAADVEMISHAFSLL
jgi:hypothetical protein